MPIKSQSPEIDHESLALFQRAFKFTDQHRPQLERTLEHDKSRMNQSQGAEKSHKGHVTDPEHDKRLTENKNKENKDRDEAEQEDRNKRKEEENKKKTKLMQLKNIQQKVNPLKHSAAPAGGYGMPTKITRPIQPSPGLGATPVAPPSGAAATGRTPPKPAPAPVPTRTPTPAPRPTGVGLPPSQRPGPSAEEYANRSHEVLTGPINTPFRPNVPSPTTPYTPTPREKNYGIPGIPPQVSRHTMLENEVGKLRDSPEAARLMGTDKINPNDTSRFDNTRQRLQQKQQQASSIQERNEIQVQLSKIAVELIKAGKLNIRNG